MGRMAVSVWIIIMIIVTLSIEMLDTPLVTTIGVKADGPTPSDSVNGIQYINGNWNVSNTQTYTDEIIVLTGHLNVLSGGSLTFSNVTLVMNSTEFDGDNIEVHRGGTLNILNGSTLTDAMYYFMEETSAKFPFMFWVREGSNFTMRDSVLHKCGHYWYGGGLIIQTDGAVVDNNTALHCYKGINLRSSYFSIISNNHLQNCSSSGIALEFSRSNEISYNEISDSGGGIQLDLGSDNNNIGYNKIYNYSFAGISLNQGSDRNNLTGNFIYNGRYGVVIGSAGWSHDFIKIDNNVIHNNTEAGLFLIGLNIGPGKHSSHEGNILLNNTIGIAISSSYNTRFINTVIDNSDEGIRMSGGSNVSLINSSIENSKNYDVNLSSLLVDAGDLTLVNTTFDKSKVFFEGNGSNITVKWYINVFARHLNGTPFSGAIVHVRDRNGELIQTGITGDDGFLRGILLTERIQNRTTTRDLTPHNITVAKDDIILYADPEPVVDGSMQVDIPSMEEEPEKCAEAEFPWVPVLIVTIVTIIFFMVGVMVRRTVDSRGK